MGRLEVEFEHDLLQDLEVLFPGAIILKNDPRHLQGVPDRTLLWRDRWAAFEVKKSANERPRPNQPYYVDLMHRMSFASFIYPENKDEVLYELQSAFRSRR